jgi:hypothetical protein
MPHDILNAMKYYIASRFANMKNVQRLTENLRALGHTVFPLVSDERNFVPGKELEKPQMVSGADWRNSKELKAIYDHDLQGLEESEIIIMLLPAGKSSHIQAGIAFGFGKKLILIGTPEVSESQYFIFDEAFPTIEDYLTSLR